MNSEILNSNQNTFSEQFEPNLCLQCSDSDQDFNSLEIDIDSDQEIEISLENNIYHNLAQRYDFASVYLNKGARTQMQDRFIIVTPNLNNSDFSFFGIFDGHGSEKVAEYLQNQLYLSIINNPNFLSNIKIAILEAFRNIDQEILKNPTLKPEESGSCVVCGILFGKKLYIANLGDSKAVLFSNNSYQELTQDHTPENFNECERIENMGGWIVPYRNTLRVFGQLNVTRAIGDNIYKPYLSCDPDIYEYDIEKNDKYLIFASDGLWNEMPLQNVQEFLSQNANKSSNISKHIYDNIISQKGHIKDNISIIGVDIQQYLSSINQ